MKVGDRIVVKSKYFNKFNDVEGIIKYCYEFGEKQFICLMDNNDSLQVFDKKYLKLIK